jgi:hypothetical protein
VRDGNLELIDAMCLKGKGMNACNKFGESVMHMACRRGNLRMVRHLVGRGASVKVVDDFGRTPLHDACWTTEPCFDVVMYLLSVEVGMVTMLDRRGASPLAYVRKEHHGVWCAFLEHTNAALFPSHRPATVAPPAAAAVAPAAATPSGSTCAPSAKNPSSVRPPPPPQASCVVTESDPGSSSDELDESSGSTGSEHETTRSPSADCSYELANSNSD